MASLARRGTAPSAPPETWIKIAFAGGALLLLFLAAIAIEMFLMLQQMRELGASLPNSAPSVDRLDAIRGDLDRMQPDLHQVNVRLGQVQSNTSGLDPSLRDLDSKIAALDTSVAQINSNLAQIAALLRDVDQHVADLDRKTGPTPPALP